MSDKEVKKFNIKTVPFRLHNNDHIILMKLLRDENLSFQTLVDSAVQAFIRADPAIMRVIKDWKELNEIPKDKLDLYTLSHRERQLIQKELEELQQEES